MNVNAQIELESVNVVPEGATEDVVLVRGVDWEIQPGDLWVVGGEMSCGKSTLLGTAAGLTRAGAGNVRFFGRSVREAGESEQVEWRKKIGVVFEGSGRLLSRMTVAENVALPLLYHTATARDVVRAQVESVLDRTGLARYAHWLPSRLSIRLQQRVALVRALILPKQVLFLDNVLSGLTPAAARWWLDQVIQARDRAAADGKPMSIVASADDLRGWLDVATHFAMIRDERFCVLDGREEAIRQGAPVWTPKIEGIK